MTALEAFIAGPAGPSLAILGMALATYLCRISGVLLMSRVRLTARVERALRALPGAIIVATALPIGAQSDLAGMAGLAVGVAVMALVRIELVALFAGLATVALGRALPI
jgi:uncharacterized membrane protein